jgi:hypothetical protein
MSVGSNGTIVNEILSDHNVDKQISDSKGDVRDTRGHGTYGSGANAEVDCVSHGRYQQRKAQRDQGHIRQS